MLELKDLLGKDEFIAAYHYTTDGWCTRNCIISKESDDISAALEDTLHRILEKGNSDDVYRIMGAFKVSPTEFDELEKDGEYIYIDLDYVIPGLIDSWSVIKRAWIENQYGENVCELIIRDDDEFVIPEGNDFLPCFLCEGDSFTVKVDKQEY